MRSGVFYQKSVIQALVTPPGTTMQARVYDGFVPLHLDEPCLSLKRIGDPRQREQDTFFLLASEVRDLLPILQQMLEDLPPDEPELPPFPGENNHPLLNLVVKK